MSRYVVGVDAGTESVRAAVVQSDGEVRGVGLRPIGTTHPHPGWAEQSPDEWRTALVESVRLAVEAAGAAGVAAGEIAGIAADGTTCTAVLLDSAGAPLRNALLWMDVRAHDEAEVVAATGDPSLAITGGIRVSAEWLPPKLLWLSRHEPDILRNCAHVLDLTDWLILQMTGEVIGNVSSAAMRWFYNHREGGVPKSLYSSAGLCDLLPRLPSSFLAPGQVAGSLLPQIAREMGLPEGLPVVAGGADSPVGLVGMGVTSPGEVGVITGSSHVILALAEEEAHIGGIFGGYPDAIVPGLYMMEGGQVSTGSILRWFVSQFASPGRKTGSGGGIYAELDEEAERVPPGSDGLVVLDHFQGNRTPWTDPRSRGVVRGLTLSHTRAHLYRAIMEGVAYGTATLIALLEGAGVPCRQVVMCGGATHSRLWTQIHADVTGKPIEVPRHQDAPVMGSAVLAAVGAGLYGSIQQAAEAMTARHITIQPDRQRHSHYAVYADQYRRSYHALAELSSELVRFETPE